MDNNGSKGSVEDDRDKLNEASDDKLGKNIEENEAHSDGRIDELSEEPPHDKMADNLVERQPDKESNSSGWCAKLIFFLLFAVFCLVATVIYGDYKPGQLKMPYESMNIPPEIETGLGKGVNAVSDMS